ncbi:DNA repair protein RadA [Chromobacterium vaccinii]|uniref:DNA repair protein RadA n=4 Tax=Chromobacteriaceae TaxID=1499392 RepID=A0A1D9LE15_9NEIS|nr:MULTISPECIES: DNA repair protein RadA [Chromobacteriaceae]AOZ49519.1 DNA repair protein RadA [Chromobacterium vaccinii]ERE05303.1 DNA repair protein RadA [Pseudogulbenkiania ferrooxidans EGD-HP2]MCD4484113.1 DNA repair protein RadA [Chromobacterium vaccinii]MCD4500902.1 DNA repair protein RadA [Chromobacterium vaccinii]QND84483.1 DNA repair protein RadA [Chromobacterium vaccinii]
MAKNKTVFSCTECGGQSPKWQGQCPHCNAWNTLTEAVAAPAAAGPRFQSWAANVTKVQKLSEVQTEETPRDPSGIDELDRVLGGGIVRGAVVLIGGDPGIGKSTLLLQALSQIGQNRKVLYVSGEESAQQIALRASRLALDTSSVDLLAEICIENILATLKREQPEVVVIDSIQTLYTEQVTSAPGSVSQVRECAAQLTRMAKQSGITVLLVGHVTKEGSLAGPRVLEHMVDTVLYFEGDSHSSYRMIRAIKNRFGAVNELGVFAMTDRGLKGVSNPSAIFLSSYRDDVAGSCVLVTQEGTRPLLVEIQALVDDCHGFQPKRLTVGLEQNRLAMLLAVLHRHGGVACFDQDVFLNAVGGVKINEPAADLAIILAMVSSLRNKALPEKLVVFGEVGLAGEVRPVTRGQERLKEAAKLGFTRAIVPSANKPRQEIEGLKVLAVDRLDQAVEYCRE